MNRQGYAWYESEILALYDRVKKKLPINEIARMHQRSVGAIKMQLAKMCIDLDDLEILAKLELETGDRTIYRNTYNALIKGYDHDMSFLDKDFYSIDCEIDGPTISSNLDSYTMKILEDMSQIYNIHFTDLCGRLLF